MMMVDELTTAESIALSMVKQALIDDDYGPFDNLVSIKPGHRSDDGDVCDDCGKFIRHGPTEIAMRDEGLLTMSNIKKVCFVQAQFVIDVFYESMEDGTIYRAVYGVPREGKPSCWMS